MLWLWVLLGAVALLVVLGVVGYNRLVRPERGGDRMGQHRRATAAPWRSHPEPRGGRQGLRRARARGLRGGDEGARGTPARARWAAGEANDILTAALGRLFAVAEAYPDLKASENFLRLQDDLTDTEDKISAARRYYNSTVMHYNTAIQSIPWVLVARPLGFHAKEFSPRGLDTAVPQVALAPAP